MRMLIYVTMVVALVLAGPASAKPILIKFSHVTAPNTPKGRGADMFKDLVHERLAGRVVVEVYPSGQLMNDDDSMEALAFGEIQMIAASVSKLDRLTKKFQIFDLPFMFRDIRAVERFQASPEGKSLLKVLEGKGFLGLAFWHNGMKVFGAPRPLRLPGDAKGLKFRIMESDVLQAQILGIGGNPQKMAFTEVYQALQTGAIDAQENTWSNTYSSKFYEVQDYIMESNHGFIGYMLSVNPDFWYGLPGDIRTELEAIVAEVTLAVNRISEEINAEARQKIIDSGVTQVIALSDEELASWRRAMTPVWDQFRDQIGEDIVRAAIAAGQAE